MFYEHIKFLYLVVQSLLKEKFTIFENICNSPVQTFHKL